MTRLRKEIRARAIKQLNNDKAANNLDAEAVTNLEEKIRKGSYVPAKRLSRAALQQEIRE